MELIKVQDAVGSVLMHDITKIIPGKFKGRAFSKGHIIKEEDIPEFLKLGKEHVYVGELSPDKVHEHDAAIRIAKAISGEGLTSNEPIEGKITLRAAHDGMCYVNEELLIQINMIDDMAVATRNHKRPVKKGDSIAALKIIPLAVDGAKLDLVEQIAEEEDIVSVKPFRSFKVGVVTTGNELYTGLTEEKFGPVIKNKLAEYGCEFFKQVIVPDDAEEIRRAMEELIAEGAELILSTGGMSVDPDDVTPTAIKATGAEIISYGVPVFPGAMFLIAYLGDVPILGIPGAVSYFRITVFDLIFPLVLAEQRIEKRDLAKLGMGGLCLNCKVCHYPICTFGTGA
ncbi:MAG TPA: molybdopterin-binding protein [Syntrophomonadaceae bacterium]|nr:molybdopterin-binding protein [Syntrophomonadaceae bacterium]